MRVRNADRRARKLVTELRKRGVAFGGSEWRTRMADLWSAVAEDRRRAIPAPVEFGPEYFTWSPNWTKPRPTKYIAFAGDIFPGEEEFFTEEALLSVAHGDHVGVKVLHCYLHWDGEKSRKGTGEEKVPYVIGHLTTHSMSGFNVVDHIAQHMKAGHIERVDVDWSDAFWLNVENRRITHKIELIEKPEAG
jgi:hypothetical protein